MQFRLRCTCDRILEVTARQAGSTIRCPCGERIEVPSLSCLKAHQDGDPVDWIREQQQAEAAQEGDEYPLPRDVVVLLTPGPRCATRVYYEPLSHYIRALQCMVEEFFAERPPESGLDIQVACALLPDRYKLFECESWPSVPEGRELIALTDRLKQLAVPPVWDGPVVFFCRMRIRGGADQPPPPGWQPFERLYPWQDLDDLEDLLMGAVELKSDDAGFDGQAGSIATAGDTSVRMEDDPANQDGTLQKGSWWSRIAGAIAGFFGLFEEGSAVEPEAAEAEGTVGPLPDSLGNELFQMEEGVVLTVQECNDLIARYPGRPDAYRTRGDLHRAENAWAAAVADYTRHIEIVPASPDGYLARAEVYLMMGELDKALEDYCEVLFRAPGSLKALHNRALLLAARQEWDRAIEDLERAVQIDPGCPRYVLVRGGLRCERADWNGAIADANECLRLDPHHPEAFALRASARWQRQREAGEASAGDLEMILADWTAAIRLDHENASYYARRAEVHLGAGSFQEVIDDCDQALQLDGEAGPAYAIRGIAHVELGQDDQAIADCSEGLRRNIEPPNVYFARAMARFRKTHFGEALSDCAEAIARAPEWAPPRNLHGMLLAAVGLLEEAAEAFDEAIRLMPDVAAPYLNYGRIAALRPDDDRFMEYLNEAIRRVPASAEVRTTRAAVWLNRGEWNLAIADCDRAIELEPALAEAYYLRGIAWQRLAVLGQAIEDFDQAVRLSPEFVPAYAERANAWAMQGDYDKAIDDYRAAVRREPMAAMMLHNLDASYAAYTIASGVADRSPGEGNLALAEYLAGHESLDEALRQCEAAGAGTWYEKVSAMGLRLLARRRDEAAPEHFRLVEGWLDRARSEGSNAVMLEWCRATLRSLEADHEAATQICRDLLGRDDLPEALVPMVCNNLSYYLAVTGQDPREALVLVDRAIAQGGPNPSFLDTRAAALLALGDSRAALAESLRAVRNHPTGIRCYRLARVYAAIGEIEAAEESWCRAHDEFEMTAEEIPDYERADYRRLAAALEVEQAPP